MGMYVCVPHKEEHNLSEGMGATNHAQCEICGNVYGDWKTKIPVIFTHDIQRPILVDNPKEYVLNQLNARKPESGDAGRKKDE